MAAVYPGTVGSMCGRFVSASPPDEIAAYFDAAAPEALLEPAYNVAPTNDVYAVAEDGGVRRLDGVPLGPRAVWAKDAKVGNQDDQRPGRDRGRQERLQPAFAKRRCIIPADGFYEWKKVARRRRSKQPYFIHRPDGEPFAFAGLWEVWRGPDATDRRDPLRSRTIITTDANETMAPIHDRMPVILPPSAWDQWLDPDETTSSARQAAGAAPRRSSSCTRCRPR